VVSAKDGEIMQGPQLLPGGQTILFTLARTADGVELWDNANVIVRSLTSGEQRILIQGNDARYVQTGHLVYALRGTVFGVPFDVRRLVVTGGPVPLVEGVRRASMGGGAFTRVGASTGEADFSVSRTGSLAYIPGPVSASTDRVDVVLSDGASITRLKLPPRPFTAPRVSPDGRRIAIGTEDGKEATVWIYELSGATTMRRLTFSGHNRFPIWTPDGKRVVFQSDREGDLGLFWTAADGSTGAGERLTKADEKTSHVPESWSPTAKDLVYSVVTGRDESLWTLSMPRRKVTPFDTVHSTSPIGAVFSPDGRWIAYTSTEPGQRMTVYVQPFPPTGPKHQLFTKETDQPHHPVWSPDGKALFYVPRPGGFESVRVTTQPTFTFGNPVAARRPFGPSAPSARRLYDITPEGKFVGLVPPGQADSGATAPIIQVVINWTEELKARVPMK
jgi:WD40 repeat protein